MLEFVVLFGREIEQFFCKVLRIVDNINWHKILTTWLDLSLLQLLQSFLLLFLQFFFLLVSVLCNSLHSFNILRVNRFLIITVILYFLNRFSSRDQKVGSNHSNFRRLTETSFSNNIDRSVIGPNISFVKIYHHLQTFLCHFICIFYNNFINKIL